MKLTPIPSLLRFAFNQEGMKSHEHRNLIRDLKKHVDKGYCASLKARNLIDDCDRAKHIGIHLKKTRMPGHPLYGDKGKDVMCQEYGIITESCGGSGDATCNGAFT